MFIKIMAYSAKSGIGHNYILLLVKKTICCFENNR